MKPIVFLMLCISYMSSMNAATGKLILDIINLRNTEGVLRIILFNKPSGFPMDSTKGFKIKSLAITGSKMATSFDSLAYGSYAVSVLHDENSNGKMDSSWYGKPNEGIGSSNNVKAKFRAPKFEEAMFSLNREIKKLKIEVLYL